MYFNGRVTRRKLLELGAEIVSRKGLTHLTIRNLAKAGKMSPGTVSHHFRKMDDLFYQIVEHILTTDIEDLSGASARLTTAGSPRDKILNLVSENLRLFGKRPHYYSCLALSYHFVRFDRKLSRLHQDNYNRTIEKLTGHLREWASLKGRDIPAAAIADAAIRLSYIIEGGLLFHAMGVNPDSRQVLKRQIQMIDSVLNDLGNTVAPE